MTFFEAIRRGLSQSLVWKGRATPNEFWSFAVFCGLCLALVGLIMDLMTTELAATIVAVIAELVLFVPLLAVLIRRLHDTGRRGAWFCFLLVPLAGWLFLIILLLQPSDRGANRFGPAPHSIYPNTSAWPK